MKTIIWTILLWGCCLASMAQKKYEVTAETFLNIRSYASTEAPVIGTIDKGGEVDVYEISDGWAKIGYDEGFAYVSSRYLKEADRSVPVQSSGSSGFDFDFDFSSWLPQRGDAEWMVFAILAISVVLFFIRRSRGEELLEGALYTVNWILFLAVTVLELVYLALMGGDAIWFCIPDKVGWLWTVIDFILFGILVYNQFMCFFGTLDDVQYNSNGYFDRRWGVYSWTWGIIAAIVSAIFFPVALPFIGVAFLMCQLVQVVLIFKGIVLGGGWGRAFLCLAIYLLGSVASILILAHFVVLLIIVLIGYFILYLFGKASGSSRGCCKTCSHYSYGYCNYHGMYISDASNKTCDNYR